MSSSTSNNNNQNINPRRCVYGCGIQIYWNSSVNEYWEFFTQKRHICPNRVNNKPITWNGYSEKKINILKNGKFLDV
jgi:hypothetical protein